MVTKFLIYLDFSWKLKFLESVFFYREMFGGTNFRMVLCHSLVKCSYLPPEKHNLCDLAHTVIVKKINNQPLGLAKKLLYYQYRRNFLEAKWFVFIISIFLSAFIVMKPSSNINSAVKRLYWPYGHFCPKKI